MNNALKLYLTFLAGAGIGSLITFFATKNYYLNCAADLIEEYSEHAEEKMRKFIEDAMQESDEEKEEIKEEEKILEEDERILNNEGVKKYHNYPDDVPEYGSKRIFLSKDEKKDIKEAVKKKLNTSMISEIEEDDFLNQDDKYEKQTIDVLLMDPEKALWGYGTDNETDVQKKFGKSLEELVGDEIDWESVIEEDEGIGILYFRNDELMTDFEVVVHENLEIKEG